MPRYLAGRLLWAVALVLGVATLVFLVLSVAPGDPATLLVSPTAPPDVARQLRANLGLDAPLHVRYGSWLRALARGDLGYSFQTGRPVTEVLARTLPNTLVLSGFALALAFALGVFLGVIQAVRHRSLVDQAGSLVSLVFYSMPSFWLALMLTLVFGYYARVVWGWPVYFPISGMVSPDHVLMDPAERLADRARHLVLPTLSLALVLAAGIARYARASMLEVIRQDYVRTARAKGLPERVVVFRHALRNALIPVVTLLGLYLPFLFSGAVFVETVFAWPGMGRLVVEAVTQRDYPVVVGVTLVFAAIVVVGNLLADLLYAVVDPRVRLG